MTPDTISGTTQFWDDPDPTWEWRHQLDRHCSNCGEPIQDDTQGNLCVVCRNRCRSSEVQEGVEQWRRAAQRKRAYGRIHVFFEMGREE